MYAGKLLLYEGVPLLPVELHAAGGWPPRTFVAGIYLPLAVGVDTGVDGILEHVLQGHAVRLAPLQFALSLSFADAHAEADVVSDQVAQQGMEGAQLLELPEDQPHHRLDLLVGVEDDLPGGPPDVPDGQGERELAAAGLGKLTLCKRCLSRCSSASLMVPFRPSSSRSLYSEGS